jgi:hypothetical protein
MTANDAILERAISLRLDSLADSVLTTAKINLLKNGSVVSGSLMDSGHVEKPDAFTRSVVFDARQAVWVEFGTMPHPISRAGIENIAKWGMAKFGLSEKEALSMAYGYANRVKFEGMEAKPFLRPAVDEELRRMM